MRTVEAKLADWNRLYKELAQAQARLAQGDTLPVVGQQKIELEAQVLRLQRECDVKLEEVQALMQARRSSALQPSRSPA